MGLVGVAAVSGVTICWNTLAMCEYLALFWTYNLSALPPNTIPHFSDATQTSGIVEIKDNSWKQLGNISRGSRFTTILFISIAGGAVFVSKRRILSIYGSEVRLT